MLKEAVFPSTILCWDDIRFLFKTMNEDLAGCPGPREGCTDGQMDGQMNGRTDGWTDGWIDRWKDGQMDGWTNRQTDTLPFKNYFHLEFKIFPQQILLFDSLTITTTTATTIATSTITSTTTTFTESALTTNYVSAVLHGLN